MAESDRDLLDRSESRIQQLFLSRILHKGKDRWLYSDEICEILRNPNGVAISKEPAVMPPSGSIFVFDKKVQKHFRNDGYQWKKAKDGRTKEGHEKLKVEGLDTLHCYYAHGKEDQSLQRRTYWMIEENLSHMVLVHYRVVKGEKRKARYIEETQTAEGVQHSRKTYEITSNCEKDNFDSSSFNPSNFQHSQATESACDGYHGGNTVTPGFLGLLLNLGNTLFESWKESVDEFCSTSSQSRKYDPCTYSVYAPSDKYESLISDSLHFIKASSKRRS